MMRHAARHSVRCAALVLALFAASGAELDAQASAGLASVRENPSAHPVLATRISIELRAIPLADALTRFGELSGISVAFSRDLLPADARVTLRAEQQPAGQVLNRILSGTGLDALVSTAGNVAIAPAPPAVRPAAAAQARAGSIRGRVVDQGTRRPLPGVFVVLSDSEGTQRAGVLTNPEGWFILQPHQPGVYALRFEIIGFGTQSIEPVDVSTAGVLLDEVRLVQTAIALASIEVEATDIRCRLPRELGVATYQLWHEARKVLALAAWAERGAGVPYQIVQYEHSRDLVTGEVLRDQPHARRVVSGVGRTPFAGATAEELATRGYVRPSAGYVTYYGLDAPALLSTAFMENHCFRLRLGSRLSDMVGLAFEPTPGRTEPGVAGVLWVNARTLELQYLEYHYTAHYHVDVPPELFGGRAEFDRLPNGAWIIRDWWIRMPEAGPRQAFPPVRPLGRASQVQQLRAQGLAVREEGGHVRFLGVGTAPGSENAGAAISGTVYDPARGRPLPRATVFLEGTQHVTVSDAQGRFRFTGLAAEEYRVGYFHAYTDSLLLPVEMHPVLARTGDGASIALLVPESGGCSGPQYRSGGGLAAAPQLVGFVLDRRGAPAPGVTVTASWSGEVSTAVSDPNGRYLLCNLPPGGEIQVQPGRTRAYTVPLPRAGIARHNLVMR
jgi:hypothetical protein